MRIAICLALLSLAGCSPPAAENAAVKSRDARSSANPTPAKPDGPFGLSLATPFSELPVQPGGTNDEPGLYLLKSVPAPLSGFPTYAVIAFPETGICEIRAVSAPFDSDPTGTALTSQMDELAEVLNARYGKNEHVDGCAGGDVFCEPSNWTFALNNSYRFYVYSWKPKGNSSNGIAEIDLMAQASSIVSSHIRLDYTRSNTQACKSAAIKAKGANL